MTSPKDIIFPGLQFDDVTAWDTLVISKYGDMEFTGSWNNKDLIAINVKLANRKATRALMQIYVNNPKNPY